MSLVVGLFSFLRWLIHTGGNASMLPPLPSVPMISALDIYRATSLLIRQHGHDVELIAPMTQPWPKHRDRIPLSVCNTDALRTHCENGHPHRPRQRGP